MEQNDIKERILLFIKSNGISISEFERRIGAGNGYVNRLKSEIKPDRLLQISKKFSMLNMEWLLYGEGEMLRKEGELTATENTPEYTPSSWGNLRGKSMKELRDIIKVQQNIIEDLNRAIDNYNKIIKIN